MIKTPQRKAFLHSSLGWKTVACCDARDQSENPRGKTLQMAYRSGSLATNYSRLTLGQASHRAALMHFLPQMHCQKRVKTENIFALPAPGFFPFSANDSLARTSKNKRYAGYVERKFNLSWPMHTRVIWASHGQNYCMPLLMSKYGQKRLKLYCRTPIHFSMINYIENHAVRNKHF